MAEAEVSVVMAIPAIWDGAPCPGAQDTAPGSRGTAGGPQPNAAPGPSGDAAPLGILPVNTGRVFLNPPKIVWECGSPCKPQGWGGWGSQG